MSREREYKTKAKTTKAKAMHPSHSVSHFYTPTRNALSDDRLHALAPSVFAPSALPGVSSRYAFVPTSRIVAHLRSAGWEPVEALEQRVRIFERWGFQKHMIRFQRTGTFAVKDGYAPELVLLNSHDRSSAYQLHAGLYRFICANGMIVADRVVSRISIRHSGFTPEEITDASLAILGQVDRITDSVNAFRARILSEDEALSLATHVWRMRFPDPAKAPLQPVNLLEARRADDQGKDLWLTLNRIQENTLRGGQRPTVLRLGRRRRMARTREVTGLDQAVRLNKGIWDLAQRLVAGDPLTLSE